MEIDLEYPPAWQIRKFVQFHSGRILDAVGVNVPKFTNYYRLHKEWTAKYLSQRERSELNADEITSVLRREVSMQKLDQRRAFYARRGLNDTNQGPAVDLVDRVLKQDTSVRRAVDIGCRYAIVFNALAQRYPAVEFACLDFPDDLASYNADFTVPNLTYVSGYPLHSIRNESFVADVALFSFVGLMVSGRELLTYYDALATKGVRWLILNEPIFYPMDGRVVDPDKLDPDSAAVTWRNCLVHNYRALVEKAGYQIEHYAIVKGPEGERRFHQRLIHLIARLR